jgi:TonB family protein
MTIGFTQSSAEKFFTRLKQAGAQRFIDVRLNNISQLAGFAKKNDLSYFLKELCGIEYVHEPRLAPTQEMLDDYRADDSNWDTYQKRFLSLLTSRKIEKSLSKSLLSTLLAVTACWCSSAHPADCSASVPAATACTQCVCATTLRRIKVVNAVYPQVAKDNALGGTVDLQFTVQPDGSTADIEVVKSDPQGLFETSAIKALSQWRYEPVIRDGKPVAQRAMVRIKFTADWPETGI